MEKQDLYTWVNKVYMTLLIKVSQFNANMNVSSIIQWEYCPWNYSMIVHVCLFLFFSTKNFA